MSFLPLNTGTDFIVNSEAITATLWSGTVPTLATYFTSSTQEASSAGNYYLNVYQTASSYTISEVQFAIAYANKQGSGSALYNGAVGGNSFTRTLYGQYRTLVLGDENADFNFGGVTQSDFYVLSIDRARYKEKLFPNTFNLKLTGTTTTVHLTADVNSETTATFLGSNRAYQLVSGSNGSKFGQSGYVAASGSYGLFLPDIGTILLNPSALSQFAGVTATTTANLANGTNQKTLVNAIINGGSFQLNAQETVTSDYIFIRSRNSEFNYSTNPSYISGSTGEIIFSSFINNPQSYITTVGMYNDSNELVAVAKLSRPLLKDFTKESLIRVKLDF